MKINQRPNIGEATLESECYRCDYTKLKLVRKKGQMQFLLRHKPHTSIEGLEYSYQAYECEGCGASVTTPEQWKQKKQNIAAIIEAYRTNS